MARNTFAAGVAYPFDAGNHSCLAPRVRRNNRTPPQNGFGRCPRGRSQPHRGLRQAHGEEDQCRREEGACDTSPHSVQGYRISSTADTSRRRHLRRMRSGLRCARLGRSRCARALSMRVTSMHRFSGRVAIARGDRNVTIARHPLSSRWWLVNARVFFAAPILTPILPSPPSRSRLSTPARFAPALVISRYVSDSPRAKTPGGTRPGDDTAPRGPPTCHLSCDKPEPMVFGRKISPGYAFQPPRWREPRALSWTSRLDNARNRRDTAFSRVFVARSPPDARAAPRVARPSGAPSPEASESSVLAPDRRKKNTSRHLTIRPPTPRSERNRS